MSEYYILLGWHPGERVPRGLYQHTIGPQDYSWSYSNIKMWDNLLHVQDQYLLVAVDNPDVRVEYWKIDDENCPVRIDLEYWTRSKMYGTTDFYKVNATFRMKVYA